MSLQGVQYAGEYEVSHIRLISSSGTTLPIEGAVVQLDFMEDIFTNSIFGAISVVDTNDLVHNMPIVGQEFLDIKIKTPTLNDEIDNIFAYPDQNNPGNTMINPNFSFVDPDDDS